MDMLMADLISQNVNDLAHAVEFIAKYIRSQSPRLREEAEKALTSLREIVPTMDPHWSMYHMSFDEGCSPEDFLQYANRVEQACQSGAPVKPIIKEMNAACSKIDKKLYGENGKSTRRCSSFRLEDLM
ncbi:hypothetical protein KY349_02515 [Candidatus Woesearchaeota archaeon]|nr:hypothetical protein [Candidatus Woesearchaeota archaeon]